MSEFEARAEYSQGKIQELTAELEMMGANPYLACVYATGSIARGEASAKSDLDVFIVDTADEQRGDLPLSAIDAALLRADLIRATRKAGFPAFSGDGIYLEVHSLTTLVALTGDRRDDYTNSFTARLLLLLESQPLLNGAAHARAREAVVGSYWRDYPGHDEYFLPVFLANDIMRYWKTVCLNYESDRNAGAPSGYDSIRWRNRNRLKDIKLKFSRKWISHTTLVYLLWRTRNGGTMSPADALEMMNATPRERLLAARDEPGRVASVESCLNLYEWFLCNVPSGKEDAYAWMGEKDNWEEARSHGEAFGQVMFGLLDSFRDVSPLYGMLIG